MLCVCISVCAAMPQEGRGPGLPGFLWSILATYMTWLQQFPAKLTLVVWSLSAELSIQPSIQPAFGNPLNLVSFAFFSFRCKEVPWIRTSTWGEGMQKTKPGPSQWCPVPVQECTDRSTGGSPNTRQCFALAQYPERCRGLLFRVSSSQIIFCLVEITTGPVSCSETIYRGFCPYSANCGKGTGEKGGIYIFGCNRLQGKTTQQQTGDAGEAPR